MTEWIIKIIDRHKSSNNFLMSFLKLIYSISKEWILGIINLVAGAFIPQLYSSSISIIIKVVLGIAIVLVNYYFYIVREYKIREYMYRRLSADVLNSCMLITEALAEYTLENRTGSGYFEYASELICTELYARLKECFGCEFRISVIQQFAGKEENNYPYCKMIARRSRKRLRNTNFREFKISSKKDTYYFVKLFQKRDVTFLCLINDKEIAKENFYYKNKKHSKIQQYVAILETAYSDSVAFILQVDCMGKVNFGKNIDEVEEFATRYLSPYVSILNNAYQHERVLTSK